MAGAWIPTSERLPPVDTKVLAYAPDFRYRNLIAIWDGKYWRRPGQFSGTIVPVEHWQPIPAPPVPA